MPGPSFKNNKSADLKVISFNMRRDTRHDYLNSWKNRKTLAAQYIRESNAGIVGVQEVLPSMRMDLRRMLKEYSIFGTGRFSGRKLKNDEHSDILIRDDIAAVADYRTFWLSKRPDEISRAYFSVFPRICTVAEVRLKGTNQRIRVFNTHFDHICWMARSFSAKMILEYMHQLNEQEYLPTILMGDLNAHPNSKPIRILRESLTEYRDLHLNDVYEHCDSIQNTHHGFKGKVKKKPIDYIFVSDDFDILNVDIDTCSFDGCYPSDHYPLVAQLRLRAAHA